MKYIGLIGILIVVALAGKMMFTGNSSTTAVVSAPQQVMDKAQQAAKQVTQHTKALEQEVVEKTESVAQEVQEHTGRMDKNVQKVVEHTAPSMPKTTVHATAPQKGALKQYTAPTDLANLSGTNILFFKASWCFTCTTLYNALVKEKDSIPAGVTIWVVDYDNNEALRKKYGVTSQHTLVQIDTQGNKINLWRGGYSVADVMSNVTK